MIISVYDFNPLNDIIEKQKILLNDIEDNLRKDIANQINKKISDKLGFDTSIRSIFRLFTTSVEIFLDQLAEVSNKAFNNPDRDKQLSKLKNGNSLDIKIDSKTIYPWPEYSENDVEKSYVPVKILLSNKSRCAVRPAGYDCKWIYCI